MAETVSVRSVEVIESRMLKAQRRYWQSRRRIELLKKQGGHKKELERLRKRTCPNTALEYNILRWVIGYQELRVNYPDDFRLLVYPIPPVSQDFKPKQITIKEAGAGGSEKLSHLDAVPVPDSEVDRLLAGFKVRRLLPFMRGRVLDVGCGAGLISEMLVEKGFAVEGVDGSPERIREAKLRVPSARFTCSLFEDYPGPEVKPDTVLLSNVLEHVDEPVELLQRCFSWLGGGGVLVAAVPNRDALHKLLGREMGFAEVSEKDLLVGHARTYDLRELQHQVISAGFRVVGAGGVLVKPIPNSMLLMLPREILEGYFKLGGEPSMTHLCNMVYCVGEKRD